MNGYHFISYSQRQAKDFASKLTNNLLIGSTPIRVWLDTRDARPGRDWDDQIAEAIRTCESLLFVMTRDSVKSQSVCKQEWTRALKYKKPIVPLRLDRDAEMPFRLGSRQYIDFSESFDVGLARLSEHLQWLVSPEGELQTLEDRLIDAERDLELAADPNTRKRIEDEVDALWQQIARQRRVVQNPEEAKRRVGESIERGLERERKPEEPVGGEVKTKFINRPPIVAPGYFQDRHVETELLGEFLKDEAPSLMTVVGRGGTGKTAMVCRLLKSLESGRLPDDGEPLSVDGIVYLSEGGSRGVSVPHIYSDLCQLLPSDVAEELERLYKDPQVSTEEKMAALLEAFPSSGRYVLLLDNFEGVLDPETRAIKSTELKEALSALLNLPHQELKVIVTTRFTPRPQELELVRPERQRRLDLDKGLPSPDAEEILRQMDADGKVGLRTAPEELLDEARKRTRGFPRALEALFAILSADRDTSLKEVLEDAEGLLPENVVEVLVGEAFSRLDPSGQMVMQALAVYAHPVTPAAVDYLLHPYRLGVDSAPVLSRLVNMQFVRREAGHYYLHQVDRAYALSRVPEGEPSDREQTDDPPFSRFALLNRAADYMAQTRPPRESWKTLDDLEPQLAEFELRYAGQDFDTAASVLLEIDFDYLLRWGHYRLVTELHWRLQGKLSDRELEYQSVNNLGGAHSQMGRNREAIVFYERALEIVREIEDRGSEGVILGNMGDSFARTGRNQEAIALTNQALEIAREVGDRGSEGLWLGSLGISYWYLGQANRAIEYFEQALEIAHEIADRGSEGMWLGGLGISYWSLGQTNRAIEYLEQALEIAREIGGRGNEALWLNNLGECYANLGQTNHAIDCCERSLNIAREIGDRSTESVSLRSLGLFYSDRVEWNTAMQLHQEAIQIADEVEDAQLQSEARSGLAIACLHAGNLSAARDAAETARKHEYAPNSDNLWALLGVIALHQGDHAAAQKAFETAVDQAESLLDHTEQDYDALDNKGLALCGLALCEESSDRIPAAIEAYRAARAINNDAGIVQRTLRLLDALAQADSEGMLTEVRPAVTGSMVDSS